MYRETASHTVTQWLQRSHAAWWRHWSINTATVRTSTTSAGTVRLSFDIDYCLRQCFEHCLCPTFMFLGPHGQFLKRSRAGLTRRFHLLAHRPRRPPRRRSGSEACRDEWTSSATTVSTAKIGRNSERYFEGLSAEVLHKILSVLPWLLRQK